MGKITSTGEGANVLFVCDCLPHHHWMAFAAWYSVHKHLPDAEIGILCHRRPMPWQMYGWANTLKVRMRYHPPTDKESQVRLALSSGFLKTPLIVCDPDVMMVRDLEDVSIFDRPFVKSGGVWVINDLDATPETGDFCRDAKDEQIATFVSYTDGWGKFVTPSWINKASSPLLYRFGMAGMTSSEVRIEKLWQQLSGLYQTVSRG